ncbi:hypothetical protein CB0940_04852 [Cercospora beticola]|uniref:DUF7918 domain-containing protein n=1 Tax=Cercospora beticola TaxID=122368 RepID=A0A2G5HJC0_CERBT|nr:hypothetical protein CB0940_04852 [Cercospora beticola]PIA92654.1 hypothetical protein CB0940_04852 [Cercospora beticola]WPB02132.1 hypothetical protein RHO25_006766 [Cercospora beticola]CAK1363012.1 unnamed protein product [Cercospora beticola]
MAINDAVPGVEIAITVDGKSLQEYTEAGFEEEPKTVTRYVEAKSNQNFAISIKTTKGTHMKGDCLCFEVYVDGQRVIQPIVTSKSVRYRSLTRVVEGHMPSATTVRSFRFDSLEKASDGKILKREAALVKSLGTIEVKCSHRTRSHKMSRPSDFVSDTGILSEKALQGRALSHSVAFEAPRTTKVWTCYETELVNKDEPCAGKIAFKYRSNESLKTEMIIPRTPSPPPLYEKEKLSQEEVRELQRQMRELTSVPANLKRERLEPLKSRSNKRPRNELSADDTLYDLQGAIPQQISTAHLPPRKKPEVVELSSDDDSD